MNKRLKQSLAAGAAIATIGIAGIAGAGLASAGTSNGQTSLVDKLATKFNLNKAEVEAVFQADRQGHDAQRQAGQAKSLAQAVTDGKLTQAQADYIIKAQKEIHSLMSKTQPGQADEATRESIHAKMDALRAWMEENNINGLNIGHGGHAGPGGMRDEVRSVK